MRQSNASSASKQADDRLLPDSVDVLHSLIAEQQNPKHSFRAAKQIGLYPPTSINNILLVCAPLCS